MSDLSSTSNNMQRLTVLLRRIGAGCPVVEFNAAAERVADKLVADKAADLVDVSMSLLLVLDHVSIVERKLAAADEALHVAVSRSGPAPRKVDRPRPEPGLLGRDGGPGSILRPGVAAPTADASGEGGVLGRVVRRPLGEKPPSAFSGTRMPVASEAEILVQDHVHVIRDRLGMLGVRVISAPGGRRVLVPLNGTW